MATTTAPIAHTTAATFILLPWIMVALLADQIKKESR